MKSWTTVLLLINTVLSLLVFLSCGFDKLFSKHGMRRIPEKFLLLTSILGGGIGLCFGMIAFHHKTNHWYFRLCAVLSGTVWMSLLTFMLLKTGSII